MDQETRNKLIELFSQMENPVKLLLFTEPDPSPICIQQQEVLKALTTLSDKVEIQVLNPKDHPSEIETYSIDKFPATVPLGKKDYGIRFFGITAGHESASLLQMIMMISTGNSGLAPEIETLVHNIAQPVHIQVFVTLSCPYCPTMVHTAHQFAYVNDYIRADMVEGSQFPELVHKYQVEGVPKTIINETTALEGTHPATVFYLTVLQAADPEEYRRIEAAMRDMQGVRNVRPMEEAHTYDVIIIGGGPAAMSAALYAARKNLDVGLVAAKIGGQMTYTAQIENYLGFPGIGGNELLQRFQFHMESYPVSELLDVTVSAVKKEPKGFIVHTDAGQSFATHTIIYCAGKEYSRLGVPNEDRFIGRGIAFCATCDAPLYTGRRVAVVGGANSAFTAVRDLLSFATEIHLIHRRETFKADAALIKEIEGHPKVIFHMPYQVTSCLGGERLTGVEIQSIPDGQTETLQVDGVFLEIGLSPNSEPVKELITLNERGEVPVNPDRSTELPGFFAAGDVTNVIEKQISVAVGDGALAALTAYKYLVENKLATKTGIDDEWL
jgi:alkyl hydroperoxide reductase subunit F